MEVTAVKKQIQAKKLDPFYVFTGDELEAQRIYVNKIAEVTNKSIKRIDQVSDAFKRRASILKASYLFVCRDDMDFWKAATPLEDLTELLGDNILILQMTTVDKRSKSYKSYTNQLVVFDYMDDDVLYKYTRKACPLSDDNVFTLIDMCERDYGRILLEADKIGQLSKALKISADAAFSKMLAEKAISRPPKDAIFDFVDAMLRADISNAFELLEECKAIGEPPLRIISVLYSNFKRVLQVQVCEDKDICGTTGLSAWDVKLAKKTVGCWASEDLVFFLKTLQGIEQGIKTGEVEEGIALDFLLTSIL